MSKPYPDKALVVNVYAEAATLRALDQKIDHPDDIAVAMVNAIESAALAVEVLWKKGVL